MSAARASSCAAAARGVRRVRARPSSRAMARGVLISSQSDQSLRSEPAETTVPHSVDSTTVDRSIQDQTGKEVYAASNSAPVALSRSTFHPMVRLASLALNEARIQYDPPI